MIFRKIEFGSADFEKERDLRNRVLRIPLGMLLSDEDIEAERHQWHFGLFDEAGELLASVIAAPLTATDAKIRQMAVSCDYQGRGLGREIFRCLEKHLAALGFRHLALHSRATAAGFYEKLGYSVVGEEFLEIGLPHYLMEKNLA